MAACKKQVQTNSEQKDELKISIKIMLTERKYNTKYKVICSNYFCSQKIRNHQAENKLGMIHSENNSWTHGL